MSVSTPPRPPVVSPLPHAVARRRVYWLVVATTVAVLIMSTVDAITADPHQSEGWIGGPIEAFFMGGPLIAVAVGLRSPRRDVAKRTAIAALLLGLAVTFVLVMQLLDANETTSDRLIEGFGVLVYLSVFLVELPALGRPRRDGARKALRG